MKNYASERQSAYNDGGVIYYIDNPTEFFSESHKFMFVDIDRHILRTFLQTIKVSFFLNHILVKLLVHIGRLFPLIQRCDK